MGTAYERAKGIVFIASDTVTFMAGQADARQQRLQELGFRALIVEPRRSVAAAEITICREWIGATSDRARPLAA